MIRLVIWKELITYWRDARLAFLGLAILATLGTVAVAGISQVTNLQEERARIGQSAREQWERQGIKHPHRAAHFGIYAFKPLLPLAGVDPGVSIHVGQSLWLEPHRRNVARNPPAADDPFGALFGPMTPAVVLIGLMPLLIIGLGYNSVTSERVSGTLRMLHSAGLSSRRLLVGKWLALLTAIGVVLLPATLLLAWLLCSSDAELARASDPYRLFHLGIALLAYYATFAAICVGVSARCRSNRSALMTLIAFWMLTVWIVPRLGAGIADRWLPAPTGEAFEAAIAEDIAKGLAGDSDATTRQAAFDRKLLADAGVKSLEELPFGAQAARRLFRDAYSTRVHRLHFDRLWDLYDEHRRLMLAAAWLSPSIAMRAVSSALSGSNLAHHRHFEQAAERYREDFTIKIDQWDMRTSRGIRSFEDKYADDEVWRSIKPFHYLLPDTRFALEGVSAELALLAAWLVAAILFMRASSSHLVP